MQDVRLDLNGYTDIPNSKIAVVVTYLEMTEAPQAPLAGDRGDVILDRWAAPDAVGYKHLFKSIGEDWLWFGRLTKSDAELEAMLREPARENFVPMMDGKPIGTLELNYADPANVELAYFGLVPGVIGGGFGKWLMGQAIRMAFERSQTKRLWLHTCTADSPQALGFYQSCGFKPFKRAIEIADDPRRLGLYEEKTAPHIPFIAGQG